MVDVAQPGRALDCAIVNQFDIMPFAGYNRNMIEKKCLICGKIIRIKKSHANKGWGKYCSIMCRSKGQRIGTWVKCSSCNKLIYRRPVDFKRSGSKKFFCSVSCHCSWENHNNRSGYAAPNWINGQTAYRKLLAQHIAPIKCAQCGIKDNRVLVVHHRDGDRTNNKVENLEWLCRNCHCIVHL